MSLSLSPSLAFSNYINSLDQNKNELELVPQPTHSHGKIPISTSDAQTVRDWDPLSHHQSGLGGVAAQNLEPKDLGRYSPLASR